MSFGEEVRGAAGVVSDLARSLVSAATEAASGLRAELAAQYTIARANLAVAEGMLSAAANDTDVESAKRTLRAAANVVESTERSLVGSVLALHFEVRQDVRELFARARRGIEHVANLPFKAIELGAHQFATTSVLMLLGIGVGVWFYAKANKHG